MRNVRLFLFVLVVVGAAACATNVGAPAPAEMGLVQPQIHALSTYSSRLGRTIELYGTNFPDRYHTRSAGILTDLPVKLELVFRGNYDGEDGSSTPIEQSFQATRMDSSTLRWTSFGPFRVPFGSTDTIGTFYGTVGVRQIVINEDGSELVVDDPQPLAITFDVEPSVVVRDFQPTTASCAGPAKRAIGGAPYRLSVEALGFTPVSYTYTVATPVDDELLEIPVTIRRAATGATDTVGLDGELVIPEVPNDAKYYPAIISVDATDASGRVVTTTFAVGVHRPLEVFYNGAARVAEIYEPQPVSGCIPGGEAGRRADYNESESESESRSYSVNWNESWVMGHSVSSSSSETIGRNETNGIGFATSNNEDFRWDIGGEAKGSTPILNLVEVSMRYGQSRGNSTSVNNSENRSEGVSESSTTTDSMSESQSYSDAQGQSWSWNVSSSTSISTGFGGTVIARTFGVFYRQKYRIIRPAVLVAYNLCGEATVVGDIDFTDWTWSPDMALANECPPFPRTNLPPAQCLVPPCGPASE